MEDVARACGVGKGTLYRYFPSKRALYSALILDGMDQLRSELEAAAAGPAAPLARLERAVRAALEHFRNRRFLLALLHRQEHKPSRDEVREWEGRRKRLLEVLGGTLQAAMDGGQLRSTDPEIAAELLLALLRSVDRRRRPRDAAEDLVASVIELFLCGVGTAKGQRAWRAET